MIEPAAADRDEHPGERKEGEADDAGTGRFGQSFDDELQRHLPLRDAPNPNEPPRNARAAFVRAFESRPAPSRVFEAAAWMGVPVALASVVGLYLFWALSAAIALNP